MTGRISDWQVEQWLAELSGDTWMALHFDNPDVAGAYNSELSGQGYARQKVTMGATANRAVWNSGAVIFAGLPASIITHICGWDAAVNGNLRFSIALPNPLRILAGSRQSFASGVLAVSLD
jgi:hypothetical protein